METFTIDMAKFKKTVTATATGGNVNASFDIDGNTAQETTTGNQLIDFTTLSNSNTSNSFTNDTLTISTSSGTYANAFKDITTLYKSNPSKVLRFDFSSITSQVTPTTRIVGLRIVATGGTSNITLVDDTKAISTHTIPADVSDITSVSMTIYANHTNTSVTNTLTIVKPILHFGSTEVNYEPYTGGIASPNPDYPQEVNNITGDIVVSDGTNSVTIPLSTEELCKIGTYKDKINIDLESGVVSKTGNIGKVVLDGSETGWSESGASTTSVYVCVKGFSNAIDNLGLSNYFVTSSTSADIGKFRILNSGANIRFCVNRNDISTLEDFKNWLSTHNTTVYYVLATPTTSTITTLSSSDLSTLKNILNGETITVTANLNTDYTINQAFQVRDFEVTVH